MSLLQKHVNCNKTTTTTTTTTNTNDETPIKSQRNNTKWTIGQVVEVASRTWPGINRPGGCGRIVKINRNEEDEIVSLDVKYMLYSGTDIAIDLDYVKPLNPEITMTRVRRQAEIYSDDVENKRKSLRVSRTSKNQSDDKSVKMTGQKRIGKENQSNTGTTGKSKTGTGTSTSNNNFDFNKAKQDRVFRPTIENTKHTSTVPKVAVVDDDRKGTQKQKHLHRRYDAIEDNDDDSHRRKSKKLKKVFQNNRTEETTKNRTEEATADDQHQIRIKKLAELKVPKKKKKDSETDARSKGSSILDGIPKEIMFNIHGRSASDTCSPLTNPRSEGGNNSDNVPVVSPIKSKHGIASAKAEIIDNQPCSTTDKNKFTNRQASCHQPTKSIGNKNDSLLYGTEKSDTTPHPPERQKSSSKGERSLEYNVSEMKAARASLEELFQQPVEQQQNIVTDNILVTQLKKKTSPDDSEKKRKQRRKKERRLQKFKDLLAEMIELEDGHIVEDEIIPTIRKIAEQDDDVICFKKDEVDEFITLLIDENKLFRADGILYRI